MAYRIETSKGFRKSLSKLSHDTAQRVLKAIKELDGIEDPRSQGKALTGRLRGLWRYRVGDYRIICSIQDDELIILALNVKHRKEAYRRR